MDRRKGFSLVELAVVMMIVGLLLAAALIPFSTQIDLRNQAETQRTLDSVKESVIAFTLANGRLPCPANGLAPSGSLNAGKELYDTALKICSQLFGAVPWATLGVPETDTWGRRFSYYVVQAFADDYTKLSWFGPTQVAADCTPVPVPGAPASFALCTLGNLKVNTRDGGTHAATPIGSALAAVIISHGKNGYGAYQSGGSAVAFPASWPALANVDEYANAIHAASTDFFSRPPTRAPNDPSSCTDVAAGDFCEFDDIVAMITPNVLIARMVSAGRLP
jgi:prepilin-type N-terminal cleavage/methylation domain-containing protein